MVIGDLYFQVMTEKILAGWQARADIMNYVTVRNDLQRITSPSGVDQVIVPNWNQPTIVDYGNNRHTPCDAIDCEPPTGETRIFDLVSRGWDFPVTLDDFNLMSENDRSSLLDAGIKSMINDFMYRGSVTNPVSPINPDSIYTTLYNDAIFNGPANGMPPVTLTNNDAGYLALASAISRAKAKAGSERVVFLMTSDLEAYIQTIPNRFGIQAALMNGVDQVLVGESNEWTFDHPPGTSHLGKAGFLYSRSMLWYCAPRMNPPNMPLTGMAGEFQISVLDDANRRGRRIFAWQHYITLISREGDIQAVFAP